MGMEWTHDRSLKLIQLYEEHEHLWNTRTVEYKNKERRDQSIQKIANELGEKPEVIRRKIANLRAQYHHELRKVTSANNGGLYDGKWFAFESLDFLREVVTSQHVSANSSSWDADNDSLPIFDEPHLLNRNSASAQSNFSSDMIPFKLPSQGLGSQLANHPFSCLNERMDFNFIPNNGNPFDAPNSNSNGEVAHSIVSQSQEVDISPNPEDRRRLRTETHYELSRKVMKIEPTAVETPAQTASRFDDFGRHVSSSLRNMTEQQADLAILKISQILYDSKYNP